MPVAGERGRHIRVRTANVSEFRIRPPSHLLHPGPVSIYIDGDEHVLEPRAGEELVFSQHRGEFRQGNLRSSGPAKTADLYGPMKQAYFSPFVLVYGTRTAPGNHPSADVLLSQARKQAFQWWRRGNGYVDVVPDTSVTRHMIENCNLILFGGAEQNRIMALIERDLPIRVRKDGLSVGSRYIEGEYAVNFIYPNPLNPRKFVVTHSGSGLNAFVYSDFFRPIHAGAGLPDYIIFDASVHTRGWAGVKCTGFFDRNWRVDTGLMYMAD